MEEYFAEMPLGNSSVLCVGSITSGEAARAAEDGHHVDGKGYYLFTADRSEPGKPIEVLAKFISIGAAEELARKLLRMPEFA